MAEKNEKISDATKDAEQRDAHAAHTAGDRPTPEESAAADKKGKADPEAAEAYEEYLYTAKDAKGEGRIP